MLNQSITDKFNIESNSTFLLKVDKTNFLVGKNNSGKSYFLRFLLTKAIKVYENIDSLLIDLKEIILSDNSIDFEYFSKFNNVQIKAVVQCKIIAKFSQKKYLAMLGKYYIIAKEQIRKRYYARK